MILYSKVKDVHAPELARAAGGFNLFSHRSDGIERAIEVKGRALIDRIHISDN